jgi:hypothetical protein
MRLDEVIVVACKGSNPQNTLDRADVLGGPFVTMTFARPTEEFENINLFMDDEYFPYPPKSGVNHWDKDTEFEE